MSILNNNSLDSQKREVIECQVAFMSCKSARSEDNGKESSIIKNILNYYKLNIILVRFFCIKYVKKITMYNDSNKLSDLTIDNLLASFFISTYVKDLTSTGLSRETSLPYQPVSHEGSGCIEI